MDLCRGLSPKVAEIKGVCGDQMSDEVYDAVLTDLNGNFEAAVNRICKCSHMPLLASHDINLFA